MLRHRSVETTAIYAKVDRRVAVAARAAVARERSHERARSSGQRLPGSSAARWATSSTEHGRLLPKFVEFLERQQAVVITTALAVEWATQPADASVVWWHQRLAVVRGFARYLQASIPGTRCPPIDLLPAKFRRAVPYLYSEAEIEALMAAAAIRSPLKAATYETLIGLLAVTGMRSARRSRLTARTSSCPRRGSRSAAARTGARARSRFTRARFRRSTRYARVRDELCPHPKEPELPGLERRRRGCTAGPSGTEFDRLRRRCGLDRETLGRRARLHDLRHSFVLRTLLGWYREGRDVEAQLPVLSTFLGHVDPSTTYWYFEARAAASRARRRAARTDLGGALMTPLAPLLQAFFTERLARQRDASPHTIAAYRDGFRLLLAFLHQTHRQGSHRSSRSRISTRRRSPRSSPIWRTSAATACAPAMRV